MRQWYAGIAGLFVGIVLAQVLWGSSPPPPPTPSSTSANESLSVLENSAVPNAREATAVVQDLQSRRDQALMADDAAALAELTSDGSPARAADTALLREMRGSVAVLNTEVLGVNVVAPHTWEVYTVQQELRLSTGEVIGPLAQRCTRWELAPAPWRIESTAECMNNVSQQ
ncbi:hypothetical protein [Actinobaculum sp. 313]|uniref:hypothetical protein n=1 Tax=Actinobaculum sp. 313 TaxID=2495645 RepID=UPI000D5292A8|nr:hypothetical protein [Actinobaculum sp. 313]AWE42544.1 hypothetical protein DDD63_07015 [Actinobaculum sp. 313]